MFSSLFQASTTSEEAEEADMPAPVSSPETETGKPVYIARSFYQAAEPTETCLEDGESVVVQEKNGTGWWCVSSKSGEGWVPSHYLMNPMKTTNQKKNESPPVSVYKEPEVEETPEIQRQSTHNDSNENDKDESDDKKNDDDDCSGVSVKDLRKMFGK